MDKQINTLLICLFSMLFCQSCNAVSKDLQEYKLGDESISVPSEFKLPPIKYPSEKDADRIEGDVKSTGGPKKLVYYSGDKPKIIKFYDKSGNLSRKSYLNDTGTTFALIIYESNGKISALNVIFPDRVTFGASDNSKDGKIDKWNFVIGRSERFQLSDNNDDGVIDKWYEHKDGVLRTVKEDSDFNGDWDHIVLRNEKGNLTYQKYLGVGKNRGNDILFLEETYDPNKPDFLIKSNVISQPSNGKKKIWTITEYGPDSLLQVLSRETRVDYDDDGNWDSVTIEKEGKVQNSSEDTNKDGKPDKFGRWVEDPMSEPGKTRRILWCIEKDRNYDGKIDYWAWYLHGRILWEMKDDDYNGLPEVIEEPLL